MIRRRQINQFQEKSKKPSQFIAFKGNFLSNRSLSSKHSSKKSSATKELEELMDSLSNFNLPPQVGSFFGHIDHSDHFSIEQSSSTRVPPHSSSSAEQLSSKKSPPSSQQHPLCHSCQKPIIGQVFLFSTSSFFSSLDIHF